MDDLNKQVEALSIKIDNFMHDLDTYEYWDNDISGKEHVENIMENILSGKTKEIKEYFETLIEESEGKDLEAEIIVNDLIKLEKQLYPEDLAVSSDDVFLSISTTDGGYDYTFYNERYELMDGGVVENNNLTIYEVLNDLLIEHKDYENNVVVANIVDYEQLSSIVEEVEMEKINYPYYSEQKKYFLNHFGIETPFHTVSKEEINAFGYHADDFIYITKEQAIEMLETSVEVYRLYPDGTSSNYTVQSNIESHTGYFGIDKQAWIDYVSWQEIVKGEIKLPFHENEFQEASVDSFAIYQIKNKESCYDYMFSSLGYLQEKGLQVDKDNYQLVYVDELQNVTQKEETLFALFYDFNEDKPDDYLGRSLSYSDVIAIKLNGEISYHYVDSSGFKELPNFLQSVELAVEQNCNMIDGIINNEPKESVLAQLIETYFIAKKEHVVSKGKEREER